jgi:hypothetical protein
LESRHLEDLQRVAREVDLEAEPGTGERLAREAGGKEPHPLLALLPRRADLAGLPARGAADCQVPKRRALMMDAISGKLRAELAALDRRGRAADAASFSASREYALDLARIPPGCWSEDGIPTLVQMLEPEGARLRWRLVERVAEVQVPAATEALARRALFDLHPDVRRAAVQALGSRPADDYRPALLRGLRHPWAPVAEHAAEALVALGDRAAVPALADLLDEPDPCVPAPDGTGKWVVSELVRVNHFRNCLLCHAPSAGGKDPVSAPVPTPGKPIPAGSYGEARGPFVRADVTYLRQDFSVMQPVERADPWPRLQRFDYLVRRRTLTAAEAAAHAAVSAAAPPRGPSYPQREAVLFALRELTGLEPGDSAAAWHLALWADRAGIGP